MARRSRPVEADEECGAAGPFLLEVGISSSYHIAKFFGLTAAGPPRCVDAERNYPVAAKQRHVGRPAAALRAASCAGRRGAGAGVNANRPERTQSPPHLPLISVR